MASSDYSLIKLWPEFNRLTSGDITSSPEGLSALVISFLIFCFTVALLFSIWKFCRSIIDLNYFRKLIKGLTREQLLERRREINNAANPETKRGKIWREFDESLVHTSQKQRLCNTLDAAHFFNTHTIARGLTENRLLAAVPGFLTAIGVIGTFAGLQLGLGPLGELDPSNAKVDDLTHGIFGMIGGASIAFMTSVWGVLTSVLFNFFEKLLERNIRRAINSFQNEVDYLYPRITAEQSLSNIEDFTRQSNDRLAELDEKIGHKMQEAMRQASDAISESMAQSLNTILAPAIERLVDSAHSGSEKALESLLERFLQGVGSAGDSQKAMMEQASKEIAAASGGMAEGLNQFANSLDHQINSMMKKNSEVLNHVNGAVQQQLESQSEQERHRQENLNRSLSDFISGLKAQLVELTEQNAATLKAVQGELSGQIEAQQGREIARQKILHEQLKGFQTSQEHITESIDGVLSMQKAQNSELLASLHEVIDRFAQLSEGHQQAALAMQTTSTELKAGSNQLGLLSTNLKAAIDGFGEQLSSALIHADNVTKSNAETSILFKEVVADLQHAGEQITNASVSLTEAALKAESGFTSVDRHFNALAESLQKHLSEVQQQVADLLSDYGERVKDQTTARLNTWNEQTASYIGAMTSAVSTLNTVVDEIDGKLASRTVGDRA
ncbi:anti-phage ZorAB system protein ZorA [Teredinibacter turnerae]|uniref:anti-phage ZorAB system protein ZorA n=1 Tax=Teredinibacter turnerae TaxID=2426 RepID=UPI00037F4954|nr:anti-phage ZorAB system protein ZorA [Teredinibacter turnerae]